MENGAGRPRSWEFICVPDGFFHGFRCHSDLAVISDKFRLRLQKTNVADISPTNRKHLTVLPDCRQLAHSALDESADLKSSAEISERWQRINRIRYHPDRFTQPGMPAAIRWFVEHGIGDWYRDAKEICMNIQKQIEEHIATPSEPKRSEMQQLHHMILALMPACKLWFLDGKDEKGKTVSNPNIGYGSQITQYANGKTKEFYQIGTVRIQQGFPSTSWE